MKFPIKRNTYTSRIAGIILAFSLLPCTLFGGLYLSNILSDWRSETLADFRADTDSTALLISKNLADMQSKMQYLQNNYEIRAYLSRIGELTIPQALDMLTVTNDVVASVSAGALDIEIRWYPHGSNLSYGNYYYTLERFSEEFPKVTEDPVYQQIIAQEEGGFLWKVRKIAREKDNKGNPQEMICLYSKITDIHGEVCTIEISVPTKNLAHAGTNGGTVPESVFLVCLDKNEDATDIVLSTALNHENSQKLIKQYHEKQNASGYEVLRTQIPNTPAGEVLYLIPKAYIFAELSPRIIGFAGIALIVIFGILSACYFTSYSLTRKITEAVTTLKTDLDRTLNDPIPQDEMGDDEISRIVLQVRKLIQDTQEYCKRIEHYEAETLRMELELLQMRFNPHLLYNTLEAINYQIRNPVAKNTINSLCSYYRIILNNGHLLIRLEEEIEMIKKYLAIVKFTYGLDNINYVFQIEEQAAQNMIIKHVLQPIVENAIHHGLCPTNQGGTLTIAAFAQEQCICIQVIDDGNGIPPEKLERLLKEPSASVHGGGYGIYNVHQRIQVYYGPEYGLKIESSKNGTVVSMLVPFG